jgi:excinuclease ABC subunit A
MQKKNVRQIRQVISTPRPKNDKIIVRGARVHNLKNINLDLPRNKLIVFTGVSGSGKSSLAFDTIYAEGQRRYVESLSSYARQFLERMDKPDVDLIQGISPAMAIEQKTNTRNPRSTVGTTTEVYDYLRLLFARIGKTYCKNCGKPVTRDSAESVIGALTKETSGLHKAAGELASVKLHISFPLPVHPKESLEQAFANLKKEGFFRVLVNGDIVNLNGATVPARVAAADISVLVDRLVFKVGQENNRLADSIETAFASGGGRASVTILEKQRTMGFNQNFECSDCHIAYEEPDPRLFAFNSPFGACPECQGFGRAVGIDMNLVVPDRGKTLRGGAIQPWATPKFKEHLNSLIRVARKANVRLDIPYSELTEREREIIMSGFEEFVGIQGFFKKVERKAYKIYYRVLLSRYRGYTQCPMCKGARLKADSLNIKIAEKNIADIVQMTIAKTNEFFKTLVLPSYEHEIARRILDELRKRLAYLNEVGIGYLTLDRLSSTLSGGESQRINLATSLGSSLVGALYVLDEPSIGLHPKDNEKLITVLKALRDVGNTVIVVEHDADMMRASDVIVDLGPRAGKLGGEVIFVGSVNDISSSTRSTTGRYLSHRLRIPLPGVRRRGNGTAIKINGASQHNLKNVDVSLPLRMLVCITGVSGSGKSTLIHDILYNSLERLKGGSSELEGSYRSLEGHDHISDVELVDQSPIGRTPRSNPVTYIKVFDHIRNLFAATQTAKIHGFQPGHFSFNVPGGRCEACEGDGITKIEMQFLADLFLTCDVCKGKRYRPEILEVRYAGKTIDDVLNMTVSEAVEFFGSQASGRKIAQRLRVLENVGLGYVCLGQPATSLSGGEAQRVKLAAHLSPSNDERHTLFILDEPTTGLHFDDIARLVACLNSLIDAGNSVIVIEHNLDVIKCADYVIDLGPEGGEHGGEVIGEGTPESLNEDRLSWECDNIERHWFTQRI